MSSKLKRRYYGRISSNGFCFRDDRRCGTRSFREINKNTKRKRNFGSGLQGRINDCSKTLSHGGVILKCEFRMKNLLSFIFILILSSCSQEQEIDDIVIIQNENVTLGYLIDTLSKNLPKTVDKNTRWISVGRGVEKKSIVYYFLVNSMGKEEFFESEVHMLKEEQTRLLLNYYCTQPSYKILRDNNIKIEHNYSDKDGNYIFSVFTGNTDCGLL